jgi:hypothetical protein
MADRPMKLRDLRAALRRYGVGERPARGKGSHTLFFRQFPEGEFTYPVPTNRDPVLICYVKGCQRRFRLTVQDGISDKDFYGS